MTNNEIITEIATAVYDLSDVISQHLNVSCEEFSQLSDIQVIMMKILEVTDE